MKVLLVGGGGREHALAWRITQSPLVDKLVVTHANPGFPRDAEHADGDVVEIAAAHHVGLVVIGPEAPLAEGWSDRLRQAGFPVFGPSMAAAQLESSKAFAKSFMDRHNVPTATWSVHTDAASAHAAVKGPCVVKADGLAAGKGVFVTREESDAHDAIDSIFAGAFGEAGHRVVVEELLEGPEVSVLALCDGRRAVALKPCRDHKRRFDGGEGPNTGGMGAICPPPDIDDGLLGEIHRNVLQPVVDGMAAEGNPFRGVLYAGLMLTDSGPKVLEFNVRFGDPECQPLMLMLDEDLVPWMLASATGDLPNRALRWREGAACCVVMVSGGYPGPIERNMPISGVPTPADDAVVFFAGAQREGETVQANGGRVLGVTAFGSDLANACERAYEQVSRIHFDTAAWRTDIGR
jgi:phosphoribosylamine--glycine ligase